MTRIFINESITDKLSLIERQDLWVELKEKVGTCQDLTVNSILEVSFRNSYVKLLLDVTRTDGEKRQIFCKVMSTKLPRVETRFERNGETITKIVNKLEKLFIQCKDNVWVRNHETTKDILRLVSNDKLSKGYVPSQLTIYFSINEVEKKLTFDCQIELQDLLVLTDQSSYIENLGERGQVFLQDEHDLSDLYEDA